MKEPPAASAPGYTLTDEHALLPLGSITWELVCLASDSVTWVAPSTARGNSGLSESTESKEIIDGVFESLGETIFCLLPQEIMRAAMGWRVREGVLSALFTPRVEAKAQFGI